MTQKSFIFRAIRQGLIPHCLFSKNNINFLFDFGFHSFFLLHFLMHLLLHIHVLICTKLIADLVTDWHNSLETLLLAHHQIVPLATDLWH